jgi:hypothetical protein
MQVKNHGKDQYGCWDQCGLMIMIKVLEDYARGFAVKPLGA